MTYNEAININLDKANEQLNKLQGDQPTAVVEAAMSVAHAYLLAALVNAVQDLTDEVRKHREPR